MINTLFGKVDNITFNATYDQFSYKITFQSNVSFDLDLLLSSFHNNLTKNNKMPGKGKGKSASQGATKSVTRSKRAGLKFPVGRISRFLRVGRYSERLGTGK